MLYTIFRLKSKVSNNFRPLIFLFDSFDLLIKYPDKYKNNILYVWAPFDHKFFIFTFYYVLQFVERNLVDPKLSISNESSKFSDHLER